MDNNIPLDSMDCQEGKRLVRLSMKEEYKY